MTALAKLGSMNKELDPRGRYDAVMAGGYFRSSLSSRTLSRANR